MKKFLAIILSALTLMLCLCSCNSFKTGVYHAEENPETGAQPVVALLDNGVATYSSNRATNGNNRATYTIDEENNLVTVSVKRLFISFMFFTAFTKINTEIAIDIIGSISVISVNLIITAPTKTTIQPRTSSSI